VERDRVTADDGAFPTLDTEPVAVFDTLGKGHRVPPANTCTGRGTRAWQYAMRLAMAGHELIGVGGLAASGMQTRQYSDVSTALGGEAGRSGSPHPRNNWWTVRMT
jgi:hypothetical protein